MNTKNIIGQRLAEARKKNGFSQLELSEQTGFGKSRISNWETGFRTPKLEEAKVLEKILKVPAPYFLGLNNFNGFLEDLAHLQQFPLIPLLTETELLKIETPAQLTEIKEVTDNYLPLPAFYSSTIEPATFAFQLLDDSMTPEYKKSDMIVFTPHINIKARHNDYVLVKLLGTQEIVFRKLCIDSTQEDAPVIKLMAHHPEWGHHIIKDKANLLVLGVMANTQRIFI